MNELNKLEFLSIVNKISIELSNHLGSEIGNDKSVAEFVISLFGGKSEREEDFMVRLEVGRKEDDGADLLEMRASCVM